LSAYRSLDPIKQGEPKENPLTNAIAATGRARGFHDDVRPMNLLGDR